MGATKNEALEWRLGANLGALEVNHYQTSGQPEQVAPGVTMSADIWHCLELRYAPAQNALRVWLDDVAVPELSIDGAWSNGTAITPAPPLEAVRFGAEIAATEAWYDDIAVGTEHIGCQ